MNSSHVLSVTTFVYGLAAFFYITALIFKKPLPGKLALWVTLAGVTGNLTGFILRWQESYAAGFGRIPLSNLYESLVFYALTIVVMYVFIELRYKARTLGAFALPLGFLCLAYASLSPDMGVQIRPLMPALKSNWLSVHVMACFVGYAAFALAFALGIMFLLKANGGKKSITQAFPDLEHIDELNHQMITFGFLFLSLGIITGAVWANSAWGRYWGWDPKETWSLITWFVYAIPIHARFMRGWKGKRIALLSIIGFAAVIFTYFGVNLLPGLHSYGA